MDKILTITVPAYNAENYLKKCLDSIYSVSTKDRAAFEAIEVIIVNDGSTDSTSAIAHEYESKAPEVYRAIDKENGGHGSGINSGVRAATGKYFKIVDADDWLNEETLVEYIHLLMESDSDVVASDFVCVDDADGHVIKTINATKNNAWYGKEVNINDNTMTNVIKMHSFTIKTEILQTYYTAIDEHCFYVDHEYITFPVPFIDTVYFDKRSLYMYRLGRIGQSMNADVMKRNRLMHRKVLDRLIEYYNQTNYLGMTSNRLAYFRRCIGDMIDNQFQIYISLGNHKEMKKELKEWDLEIKRTNPDLYNAISKKSISVLRFTNYEILPFAYFVYRLVKKRG